MEYRKYAISYIRFSTDKQALGNSYDRQFDEAKAFCKKRDIKIVNKYKDLGRSAYKSFNLMPGSDLAFFIKSLENHEVPNPNDTYLLIESLDRLSRAPVNRSLKLFTQILEHGISIITLIDGKIYDANDNLDKQTADFITSIMLISKAHAESLDKSYRISKAWQAKKESARKQAKAGQVEVLTKMSPFWLGSEESQVKDEQVKLKYVLKEDYASTIRLIFDLATGKYDKEKFEEIFENKIDKFNKLKAKSDKKLNFDLFYQSLSSNEIVKVLNSLNIPVLNSGKRKKTNYWNTSNINKVLISIALTGVYQPKKLVPKQRTVKDEDNNTYKITRSVYQNDGDAIENFYPVVISKTQFSNAQLFKTRRQKGRKGRKGLKFSNVFNSLAVCRLCGSNMVHNNKGKSRSGKKWVYLQCSLARVGGDCEYISANYEIAEYNILRFIKGSDFSPVIGSPDKDQNQIEIHANNIKIYEQQLAEVNDQFIRFIGTDNTAFKDVIDKKINELEQKKIKLTKLLDFEKQQHDYLVANKISEKFDRKSFGRLVKNIDLDNAKFTTEEIYFSRMKVNSIISSLLQHLLVDSPSKKATLVYVDGSAQVIDITKKVDSEDVAFPNINVPKLNFCKNTTENDQSLLARTCYQFCGEALDGFLGNAKGENITGNNIKKFGIVFSKILAQSVGSFANEHGFDFTRNKSGYHFSKKVIVT
jgi:DNA invertase Pin-like site-specific DNA recombinase